MSKRRGGISPHGSPSGRRGTQNSAFGSMRTSKATLSFNRLPRQHHKNLKSTNMLERIMEEIKRRTLVVRIFPHAAGCLRLVRALAAEMHENWIEAIRYLNMEPLREQNKRSGARSRMRHDRRRSLQCGAREGASIAGPSPAPQPCLKGLASPKRFCRT